MTTQYVDEPQHCDKIGLVRQGKLIADGTSSQITRQSKTESLEHAFLAISGGQVTS